MLPSGLAIILVCRTGIHLGTTAVMDGDGTIPGMILGTMVAGIAAIILGMIPGIIHTDMAITPGILRTITVGVIPITTMVGAILTIMEEVAILTTMVIQAMPELSIVVAAVIIPSMVAEDRLPTTHSVVAV